MSGHGL
jgi:MoxR-like ATPase